MKYNNIYVYINKNIINSDINSSVRTENPQTLPTEKYSILIAHSNKVYLSGFI